MGSSDKAEKKAKAARVIAHEKYAKANAKRISLVKKTKKAHHATKHVLSMIHKLKVKHTKMVIAAKAIIAKLHSEHKKAIANVTAQGKALIVEIVHKIKKAEEAHDKQINWYKIQIAKLNKLHTHHNGIYLTLVKKTKVVVHMTAHYNKHIKITSHQLTVAHALMVKYVNIKIEHEKNTKISLAAFKKWTVKAKHAIHHRDEANAASVKAIALRVKAEADYATHHANMLIAQKKSHVLRLQVVRYRKVVAKFNAQTKKNNSDTKFHQGKEAHWNKLAAQARATAKKYLRHAAIEHKLRLHWIVIYKKRVAAEKIALAKAMKNNAAAAAMEARARVFAEAAKRATRLALREQKLRIAAEKRTKIYIAREIAAHHRYQKEEKKRFHFVRLAKQADRKAAREWERRNRYVKEMKHAIKAMILSVAHRKKVVAKAMIFVSKQNEIMIKANEAAEKSGKDKISADIKAADYRKHRDHFNSETAKFVAAAHKAMKESKVAKAKHAKFDALRIVAEARAAKYLKHAKIEISRRVFLDKVARAARLATASFRGKVVVQKKFTATAWKQYHSANKASKVAIHVRTHAVKVWTSAVAKYKKFHAKMLAHKKRTAAFKLAIKVAVHKHAHEQKEYNKLHAEWKVATTKAHKDKLTVRLNIHTKNINKWLKMIAHEKKRLALHLVMLAHQHKLFLKAKKLAEKMHEARVKAEADAKAAHKALEVAVHLRKVEVKKAKIAHHNAEMAEKRMRESIARAKVALGRRLHAEKVSAAANLKMKHAIRWAHKMLHIRKLAVKLYLHHKERAAKAKKSALKMTILSKQWVRRAKDMHHHAEKARIFADKARHTMEKAQQHAAEASAAHKRAQFRLTVSMKKRHSAEHTLRIVVKARVHAHAVLRAAIAAHKRAYAKYVSVKKVLFLAQAAVARAVVSRRIAEREAKKRLAFQQIRLHKWLSSHIALRKIAMAASIRARISAQVAHTQHMRAYHLRVKETKTQVARTIRQAILLAKMTAHAKTMARRAERDARLRLRQRNVARLHRNRAIAAKLRAAAKAAREAAAQRAALLKAQAIRKAVHDYIMKVRLQHAVRNHKFDLTQCKAAKKNLHALWGQHSLKSRKAAMRAARKNWCRAASTRNSQIKALQLVVKGKLTMSKVHTLRKSAFNLERRARGQHNYVWSPRKSTCKDKCMKYKDWLKVVTALAKAMAMKPCGKVPGAPTAGVQYITHNKSVKIVHGNKMVLTHHITYHVCKA